MPKRAKKDAELLRVPVSADSIEVYREAAKLEGVRMDWWIREILREAVIDVLESAGRDTSHVPPAHPVRAPRLQPRIDLAEFEGRGGEDTEP